MNNHRDLQFLGVAMTGESAQYTSEQFRTLMANHGIDCSMSRSGNVWDNAAMESFFSPLKTERVGARSIERATPLG